MRDRPITRPLPIRAYSHVHLLSFDSLDPHVVIDILWVVGRVPYPWTTQSHALFRHSPRSQGRRVTMATLKWRHWWAATALFVKRLAVTETTWCGRLLFITAYWQWGVQCNVNTWLQHSVGSICDVCWQELQHFTCYGLGLQLKYFLIFFRMVLNMTSGLFLFQPWSKLNNFSFSR